MSRFTPLVDLASARLGGVVLAANDEFFAPKENLLKPDPAIFIADKYTDRGKWMDGWETRRRRTPGHDWCIVKLGLPGVVKSVVVDTSFFRGNFPSHCSIEGAAIPESTAEASTAAGASWRPLVGQTELRGDAQNTFTVEDPRRFTHVRLNIFPDGGVARLRVLGEALPDWRQILSGGATIDLASIAYGAHIVDASDRFFGDPTNMLTPHPAVNMGDGWETKRRRAPGHDWVVIRLAVEGTVERILVGTVHFKGNYPESCSAEAAVVEEVAGTVSADLTSTVIGHWKPLLPRVPLQPDHEHVLVSEVVPGTVATHIRLNIFPDGGISRLRIFGTPTANGRTRAVLQVLNCMDENELRATLSDYCAAPGWIARMIAARPYGSASALLHAADKAADCLTRDDWLEAFRHHPAIGGRDAERAQSAGAASASAGEQAAFNQATAAEIRELADANRVYRDRFGHLFIISAVGKTTPDILSHLRRRLTNDPDAEMKVAADEQRRITRLRLEKLLG